MAGLILVRCVTSGFIPTQYQCVNHFGIANLYNSWPDLPPEVFCETLIHTLKGVVTHDYRQLGVEKMPYLVPDELKEKVIDPLDDLLSQIKSLRLEWQKAIKDGKIPAGDTGRLSVNYVGPMTAATKAMKKIAKEVRDDLESIEEGIHRFRSRKERARPSKWEA